MDQVSRPLLVVLVAVVAAAGVWFVALRPGGSDGGTTPTAGLGRAVAGAHGAVGQSRRSAGQIDGVTPTTGAPATGAPTTGAPVTPPPGTAPVPGAPVTSSDPLRRALAASKVAVVLFFNPRSSDDQAARRAVLNVDRRGGRVAAFAFPLRQLARYGYLTRGVPVLMSPTVLIVDRTHAAQVVTGLTDEKELNQRVTDALAGGSAGTG